MAKKRITAAEANEQKRRVVSESLKKSISAAMKGNKNAEKWTEKLVMSILKKMITLLSVGYREVIEEKEEDISGGRMDGQSKESSKTAYIRVHHKKELLVMLEIWNTNWFLNMSQKFKEKNEDGTTNENYSPSVLCLLGAINMLCEVNTYKDAFAGKGSATMASMLLAKHYGYSTSKTESKVTVEAPQFELPDVPDAVKENFNRALKQIEDAED